MTQSTPQTPDPSQTPATPPTPPVTPAPEGAPDVATLQADLEKWKALSRQNEKNYNDARTELSSLKESQMTDAEKAIEAARTEARNAALSEVGSRLVDAELRVQAATAGVTLPAAEYLNTTAFVGADGAVNTDAIKAFVQSIPKPSISPEFAQGIGLGRQSDASYAAGQLGRDALSRMSPSEINAARKAGKLDAVMKGDL